MEELAVLLVAAGESGVQWQVAGASLVARNAAADTPNELQDGSSIGSAATPHQEQHTIAGVKLLPGVQTV